MKKRTGGHEHTIRELFIDRKGLRVGPALGHFQSVFAVIPSSVGAPPNLLARRDDDG